MPFERNWKQVESRTFGTFMYPLLQDYMLCRGQHFRCCTRCISLQFFYVAKSLNSLQKIVLASSSLPKPGLLHQTILHTSGRYG